MDDTDPAVPPPHRAVCSLTFRREDPSAQLIPDAADSLRIPDLLDGRIVFQVINGTLNTAQRNISLRTDHHLAPGKKAEGKILIGRILLAGGLRAIPKRWSGRIAFHGFAEKSLQPGEESRPG